MPAIVKEWRFAGVIIRTLVKDSIHYPTRLVSETFILASRCGLLLLLYWYVFNLRGGTVGGTTFPYVAWSMYLYFALSSLRIRGLSEMVMADVQSGNVEVLMNKPISYLSYRAWWQIGSGAYPFLVVAILGTIALVLTVGIPVTMTLHLFLPTFILTFLGAVILSTILYMIVGLMAFWVEDISPLYWILDKTIMILGGSYLPIALFPALMYKIAIYSPFGASQFVSHAVLPTWQTDWYNLVGIQIIWIVLLGALMLWIFNKAKQKISVNGG